MAFVLASSASCLILSAISASNEIALMSRVVSSRPLLTSATVTAELMEVNPSSFAFVALAFKRVFAPGKISALSISRIFASAAELTAETAAGLAASASAFAFAAISASVETALISFTAVARLDVTSCLFRADLTEVIPSS